MMEHRALAGNLLHLPRKAAGVVEGIVVLASLKRQKQMSNPIPNPSPPPIEVHDLTVSYDKKPVLWNIDVAFPEGEIIGIIGPNGAGKSTLIKAIMGLIPAESGWVRINGEPLSEQ